MKALFRSLVLIILCSMGFNLQAQYKTDLNSGNFNLTTSSGAGFVSSKERAVSSGFQIPYNPGTDESLSILFHSVLNFGGFIDSNLHVHKERYFPEFQAGPVLSNGNYPEEYGSAFDTIWIVRRHEIQSYLEDFKDGQIDQEHPSIFGWPAKGNQILLNDSVSLPDQELAPFHDQNNNGRYEPMLGDYPSQDGELSGKAIPTYLSWSVYNTGPTTTDKLGRIEVQTIAYAYACENSTVLNNTPFFKMKVINRNPQTIQQFRIPVSFDGDLGCTSDDYWGTDTLTESIYFYPATIRENECLGGRIPLPEGLQVAQSLTFLNHNLDASNDHKLIHQLADQGNNLDKREFYNLISGKKPDGSPIPFGWGGPLEDSSNIVTQLFTDRPSNTNGWNMRNLMLSAGDCRPYASIFIPELQRNQKVEIDLALVTSLDTSGRYDNFTIVDKLLDEDIPKVIGNYQNDFSNIECDYAGLCNEEECVWPGDSNNDERVFIDDFIQTGWLIKENKKGNERIYPSSDWLPFHSESWSEAFRNIDLKHSDASGEGRIQVNDLEIIKANFQEETPLYQSELWRGPRISDVSLKIENAEIRDYQAPAFLRTIPMRIRIGSNSFPVEDLHSICFTVAFEDDYIDLERNYDDFLDSTYSGFSINSTLKRLGSDHVHIAITDFNDTSYSGALSVAEFYLRVVNGLTTNNASGNIVSQMNLKNVLAIRNDGTEIPLKLVNGTLTIKNVEISTASNSEIAITDITIFPNPAEDMLYFSGLKDKKITASIYDASGKLITTSMVSNESINISALGSGLYFLRLNSEEGRYEVKRFVKF